ncbi:MAG: DUF1499 domain-containing protein [Gammaproteobacteria bacterium]|nr:DUF1499 domain-containing protein [Gammaproteobacteria bacterium]
MKTALISLSLLVVAFIVLFLILGVLSKSGKAPGLVAGRLPNCPDKPNCVNSEQGEDAAHLIEPLAILDDDRAAAVHVLKDVIREMGGRIEAESDDYLAATFSSAIFGFVDDLEIRVDSRGKVIHLRSSSRVGHSDMGVNRKRTELLRKRYIQKVSNANLSPDSAR